MSMITIRNEELTVQISTRGAEMQSIRDREGNERLWQGDPAFWTGRAPIMFPICGGLKDDTYFLAGRAYRMPKHGFAKLADWQPETVEADRATLLLTEKHEGFPFDYEFRATFALQGKSLTITFDVRNTDSRAFWFGIGSHEAYATPGGIEQCSVVFDEPETLAVNDLQGNLILPEPRIMAENVKDFPLKTSYFLVDALVFRSLKSRGATLVNHATGKTVRVDFEGMDVLMLWQKPGAEYICLEPWTNAPDTTDTDQQIEHKPGCIRLLSGEKAIRTHTITFG